MDRYDSLAITLTSHFQLETEKSQFRFHNIFPNLINASVASIRIILKACDRHALVEKNVTLLAINLNSKLVLVEIINFNDL